LTAPILKFTLYIKYSKNNKYLNSPVVSIPTITPTTGLARILLFLKIAPVVLPPKILNPKDKRSREQTKKYKRARRQSPLAKPTPTLCHFSLEDSSFQGLPNCSDSAATQGSKVDEMLFLPCDYCYKKIKI
jgi:hypothetical protein